jgi:hypothetical protein
MMEEYCFFHLFFVGRPSKKSPYSWKEFENRYVREVVNLEVFSKEYKGNPETYPTLAEVLDYSRVNFWIEKRETYRIEQFATSRETIDEKIVLRHLATAKFPQTFFIALIPKITEAIESLDLKKLARTNPVAFVKFVESAYKNAADSVKQEKLSQVDLKRILEEQSNPGNVSQKSLEEIHTELSLLSSMELSRLIAEDFSKDD